MADRAELDRPAPARKAETKAGRARDARHDALAGRRDFVAALDHKRMLNARPAVAAQRKAGDRLAGRAPGGPQPAQPAAPSGRAGLPDGLKNGVEALSGLSLDGVRVHYNSAQPARLQAHAFTQGTDIHLAPGQERHLPHEAWHVVQQAQGRVKPTMQMKGGIAINEDAGLEREADVMGSRAAAFGDAPDRGAPAVSPRPAPHAARAPVQRYKVRDKYHVSNDDTAAVVDVKNNKELYTTAKRIDDANAALGRTVSNIRFAKGPFKTVADKPLIAARPVIDDPSIDKNVPTLQTGKGDKSLVPVPDTKETTKTGVQLPSECEKGAIAIVGAYLEDHRQPDNTFDYGAPAHATARIANLIAKSTAAAEAKQLWYDEWQRLEAAVGKAANCLNQMTRGDRVADNAGLAEMRAEVRKTDAGLADDRFAANFKLDDTHYVTRTTRPASIQVLQDMIRLLDGQINALEREVMSDVDPTYKGHDQDVLAAGALRDKLINLYAAQDFPKATIDAALKMTGKEGSFASYFAAKKDDPQNYANALYYNKQSRMKEFLEQLVAAIGANILKLEARRDARFGSIANQNKAVDPEVGQAYGIVGGHYNLDKGGRWNWHWAGVVLKTDSDNITMEAHASHKQGKELHNENWDFKMYGRPAVEGNEGKTFHDIWRDQGFGLAPVTVLGEPSANDVRIRKYHLENLTLEDVAKYKKGAGVMYDIMEILADRRKTKEKIVPYYYDKVDRILGLTNNELPRQFVEERLHDDLNRQMEAVMRLKKPEVEMFEQSDLEIEVADTAGGVRTNILSMYGALCAHERVAKKKV